eukprot:1323419-Pyramimonas_sp.AAC.1
MAPRRSKMASRRPSMPPGRPTMVSRRPRQLNMAPKRVPRGSAPKPPGSPNPSVRPLVYPPQAERPLEAKKYLLHSSRYKYSVFSWFQWSSGIIRVIRQGRFESQSIPLH